VLQAKEFLTTTMPGIDETPLADLTAAIQTLAQAIDAMLKLPRLCCPSPADANDEEPSTFDVSRISDTSESESNDTGRYGIVPSSNDDLGTSNLERLDDACYQIQPPHYDHDGTQKDPNGIDTMHRSPFQRFEAQKGDLPPSIGSDPDTQDECPNGIECSNGNDNMHKLKLSRSQKQRQKQKQKQTPKHAAATPQVSNPEAKVLLAPLNPLVPRASRGCEEKHRGGSRDFSEPGEVKPPVCVTQYECTNGIDTMHNTLSPSVCGTQDERPHGIDTRHSSPSPSVCGTQEECSHGIDTMHSSPSQSADGSQPVCGTQEECSHGIDNMHSSPSQLADQSQSFCGTQEKCSNGTDTLHSIPKGIVSGTQDDGSKDIDTLHSTPSESVCGTQDECPYGIDFRRRCAEVQEAFRNLSARSELRSPSE